MKYYIATTVLLAAFSDLITQQRKASVNPAVVAHMEWKRNFKEPEILNRPAYFEDMKWSAGADLRGPASTKSKSKKK
jgi:hypothetical protein